MIANDVLLQELTALLGPHGLLVEESDRAPYEQGWRYGQGTARAIARPRTAEELAQVLARCHRAGVRVQPIGANTGLVGASNPDASGEQLVVAFDRMTATIEIDPLDRTVLVDAGVTLSSLNEALEPHGLVFPIDLGADPQVGGMIATNTGGTRLVQHGDVRRHVLGVEVALADGTIWSRLSRLRKDNTGLDWKHLFTGTSGVFGMVTRAVLNVVPKIRQQSAVLAACDSGEAVLQLLAHVEREAGELLSAYEVLSGEALEVTLRHGADVRNPFPEGLPAYAVLIELASSQPANRLDLDQILMEVLEPALENQAGLLDVMVEEAGTFWHIRHQVSEGLALEGRVLAFDLSVPRSRMAEFSAAVRQRLHELSERTGTALRVADFGHWGDGGTHLNLILDRDAGPRPGEDAWIELQTTVYELCVQEFAGSYSAEHGVGPHNQRFYDAFTPASTQELCEVLKQHLDPENRLGTLRLTPKQ